MGVYKNFVLQTEPENVDDETNVVKFIVKDTDSIFLKYFRTPLILGLVSIAMGLIGFEIRAQDSSTILEVALDHQRAGIFISMIFLIVLLLLQQQKYDSIIVMKNVGVQLNSYGHWRYFGTNNEKNCFIPQKDIIDIVIHEGFHGFGQVIFYLCILTKSQYDENMIKIVFPNFLPRRALIEEVWRKSRVVSFGTSRRYWRRVPGQGLKECISYTS